jgi:hypothetical protein
MPSVARQIGGVRLEVVVADITTLRVDAIERIVIRSYFCRIIAERL